MPRLSLKGDKKAPKLSVEHMPFFAILKLITNAKMYFWQWEKSQTLQFFVINLFY